MPPYNPFTYTPPTDLSPFRPPPPPSYRDIVTGRSRRTRTQPTSHLHPHPNLTSHPNPNSNSDPNPTRNSSSYTPSSNPSNKSSTSSTPRSPPGLAKAVRPLDEYAVGSPWSKDRGYGPRYQYSLRDWECERASEPSIWSVMSERTVSGRSTPMMGWSSPRSWFSGVSGVSGMSGLSGLSGMSKGSSLRGGAKEFVPGRKEHRIWRDRKEEWDPEFWG